MGRNSALLATALASLGAPPPAQADRAVDVQLVALNDFHGHLEAASGLLYGGEPAGGVEYLSTHVRRLERGARHSFVVSAGDLVGGSPLLSAMFHDEPTIEAMNALGLDANAVGNHELDDGAEELLRLQRGGEDFAGADFPFLAANVVREGTDETLLPPFVVRRAGGEKIAFVGMTLEDTPSVTTARGAEGLDFRDEAETVNALVPELRRRGAETIVVLLHEGGHQSGGARECEGIAGPVVDVVRATSREVDLFVTGHTHTPWRSARTTASSRATCRATAGRRSSSRATRRSPRRSASGSSGTRAPRSPATRAAAGSLRSAAWSPTRSAARPAPTWRSSTRVGCAPISTPAR
jgi:5'-nucleotidase